MPLLTIKEYADALTPHIQRNNASIGFTNHRLGLLGDGQFNIRPDKLLYPREVFYRSSLDRNDRGIAVVHPSSGIPLNALDGWDQTTEVWLGNMPGDTQLYVLGIANTTGETLPNGVNPMEALIQQAAFPTLDRFVVYRIRPSDGGGLAIAIDVGVYAIAYNTGGGNYDFSNSDQVDLSDPTSPAIYIPASTDLASGEHRLVAIALQPSTGGYIAIAGTAVVAASTLGTSDSRSEFEDPDFAAINLTGYVPCGYVYQYYGQTDYTEDDCMRHFDPRQVVQPHGLLRWGVTSVAADYTLLSSDNALLIDTSAARAITLGPAANYPIGLAYLLKDASGSAATNNITITPDGTETIDGDPSKTINSAYGAIVLIPVDGGWISVSTGGGGGGGTISATPPTTLNAIATWGDTGATILQDNPNTTIDPATGDLTANAYVLPTAQAATLSSDAFTATKGAAILTSQTGTSDNLSTINGMPANSYITLQAASGHTITVKHNVGNIKFSGAVDFVLSGDITLLLYNDGTNISNIDTYPGITPGSKIAISGTTINATPTMLTPGRACAVTNVNVSSPGASMDSVSLSSGDIVYLFGQSTASQCGPWIWNGAAVPMTRPTWFASGSTAFAYQNVIAYIYAGAVYQGSTWRLTTTGTITIDTTSQSWSLNNSVYTQRIHLFPINGTLSAQTGSLRMYNIFGKTLTFRKAYIAVSTAPTGASILVDINKGGTTIFTTQANRPSISASANTGSTTTFDVTTWADGEYLTFDIDQVGSTIAGAYLTIHLLTEG